MKCWNKFLTRLGNDSERAKEAKGDLKGAEIDRKSYMPLWDRASRSKTDVRGANVIGTRAWEPFISLLEAKALSRN